MLVLAFVLGLGVSLVLRRLGVHAPGGVARHPSAIGGIDGKQRHQPFEIGALTFGTRRSIAEAHDGFELVPAGAALIFVYGHISPLSLSQNEGRYRDLEREQGPPCWFSGVSVTVDSPEKQRVGNIGQPEIPEPINEPVLQGGEWRAVAHYRRLQDSSKNPAKGTVAVSASACTCSTAMSPRVGML